MTELSQQKLSDSDIKLSIITVTKNNSDGLKKTHKSLDGQTPRTEWEWIVIDGASEDNTTEFCEGLKESFPNLRYTSEKDHGIYEAMNKGLMQAQGQYLLFLNAGDQLAAHDTLEKIISDLHDNMPDFFYGDSLEPQSDNKPMFYKKSRSHTDILRGMFTHHQSMIYARKIITTHHLRYHVFYDIAGDYDFTLRFLDKAEKITYWPHPVCIFEQNGVSMTNAYEGRKEQFMIRENLKLVTNGENVAIFTAQSILWLLRQKTPAFYGIVHKFITRKK